MICCMQTVVLQLWYVKMQLVNAYLHPTLQLLLYIRLQLSVSLMVITDVDAYTPVLSPHIYHIRRSSAVTHVDVVIALFLLLCRYDLFFLARALAENL